MDASKILETNLALAIVPLRPKSRGHCLVLPKDHAERMHDIPSETLHQMIDTIRQIAIALNLESYNVLQNSGKHSGRWDVTPTSETVSHVHFHLIPRSPRDRIDIMEHSTFAPSRDELERLAREIRDRLGA
jgi:diadenosine tetraphosphate (Ap4A) HIT family hydrolase